MHVRIRAPSPVRDNVILGDAGAEQWSGWMDEQPTDATANIPFSVVGARRSRRVTTKFMRKPGDTVFIRDFDTQTSCREQGDNNKLPGIEILWITHAGSAERHVAPVSSASTCAWVVLGKLGADE